MRPTPRVRPTRGAAARTIPEQEPPLATSTSGKRDARVHSRKDASRKDAPRKDASKSAKKKPDAKKRKKSEQKSSPKSDGKSGKRKGETSELALARATATLPTSRGWAVLAELLGRRACLRVLWELRGGPLKFRPLQAACDDLSPSTLNQRLADLREARLVVLEERQGYRLTPQGEELARHVEPLATWAEGWSHRRAQRVRTEGPPRKRARSKLG